MAIKIAHASISEKGTVNGNKGDQTGKEVCIRPWYNFGYTYVLRCKDPIIRNRMVQLAKDGCANDNIGYSQADRNSLHKELLRNNYDFKKVGKCNTDCSAYITVIAIGAGVKSLEYTNNAPTTATMMSTFRNTGLFDVLTEKQLLNTDANLMAGDILLKPYEHVVMVIEDGKNIVNPPVEPQPTTKANVCYQVSARERHYGEVVNLSDYAGIEGIPFDKLAMRVDQGSIQYQVHLVGAGWLPYVSGYQWGDNKNGYAGLTDGSKNIDGIRVKTKGTGGKIKYRVSTLDSTKYLDWVIEDKDYAGILGKPIDKFQAYIV